MSQRHLSFVESGRSRASRQMLHLLADALDIPLRDRNLLLVAGGHAPAYPERSWDDPALAGLLTAVRRMLAQHEPYPAIVMDRYWNVVMTNAAASRFFGRFVDLGARPQPRNLLHLMFDPAGMRPFLGDWPRTAAMLLARVHREAVGRAIDDQTGRLVAALRAYPDVPTDGREPPEDDTLPVLPLTFLLEGQRLRYFSLLTTVGSPIDALAQEMRVECLFPADAETEVYHLAHFAGTA